MKLRTTPYILTALALATHVVGEVAPEITIIAEGYNLVTKLPCIACPFLYQDTSHGTDTAWTQRKDSSALLLNISLPIPPTHLTINSGPFLSPSHPSPPKVYAPQILLDTSVEDLASLVATDTLDTPGGAFFGLSYAYSVHRLPRPSAGLLFRFDVLELWTDLTTPATTIPLTDESQKMLEVVLLPRPVLSAGDASPSWEIVRAELVPRGVERTAQQGRRTMWFLDWDENGKKGTASHVLNSAEGSLIDYATSGVWSLFIFILAIMALFIVMIIFVIFACGWNKDDYRQAQHGKRKGVSRGSGTWGANDVEKARRFRSAEELGIRSGGTVVGVGKSD
ncbi:hypothetical protein ACN47E_004359 [Coniothyrium glycines]